MFVPPFPHLQRESLLLHTKQIICAFAGYYWLPRNILTERYRSPRSRKKKQQQKNSNNNKRTTKMVPISYYRSQKFNNLTIFTFTLDSTNCFLCLTKIRNYTNQMQILLTVTVIEGNNSSSPSSTELCYRKNKRESSELTVSGAQ